MKHQITTTKGVRKYLYDLIDILYEREYFGFEEDSIAYITSLFEDIEQNLPKKIRKPAPEHFDKYGYNMYYASFKKNLSSSPTTVLRRLLTSRSSLLLLASRRTPLPLAVCFQL